MRARRPACGGCCLPVPPGPSRSAAIPEPIPDESWPYPVDLCGDWPYYLSKIYQEKLALELAPKLGIELVVLNPSPAPRTW